MVLWYSLKPKTGRDMRLLEGGRSESCERDVDENSLRIGPAVIGAGTQP